METDFIYWRHILPHGIKIEEISGCENKEGGVWRTLAYQVYGENGKDGFRNISHTEVGAPLLEDNLSRISVTHTGHLLAVATLPKTPEADLTQFNPRTALGIDAEQEDRKKVIDLRQRFLNDDELEMIPADDVKLNIMAWTAKEALYKAALSSGLDWRNDYRILSLPPLQTQFPLSAKLPLGKGEIRFEDGTSARLDIFSYLSDGYIITVAFSPKCAKFKKTVK
ncbi:MAG: 4'-phosphopantetheinyl transferase superfamily protein [Prevotella sp.]|nr:4'-phosphopantetheinyl transferase superfamily protein [Bacteroides sp.]MCM1366821.1 4'-phosphopantetheinyl transferase superfamily protein [Prevotella sp.]MCM1437402.1 4'-phosphopantetheinyl transferase superfamily protein [Prevotella sp.]